jgi:uracil-DNA glycosylase
MNKQIDILEIEESWYELLKKYFDSSSFSETIELLKKDMQKFIIYPKTEDILNAYNSTTFENIRVVIIGQDPYHRPGQAHGLAFSINEDTPMPPSLKNIYKEIDSCELLDSIPEHGNLQHWADQGILLLNTYLTVREGQPLSHSKIGWQSLTDYTILQLSEHKSGLIFVLWGKHAQSKEHLINKDKHYILKAAHPSPFSASYGFFGCNHFKEINKILESNNEQPIKWTP